MEEENESSNDEQSHFQFINVSPEQVHNNVVLKQSKGKLRDLDLRSIILLDNQSNVAILLPKFGDEHSRLRQTPHTTKQWWFDEGLPSGGYWEGPISGMVFKKGNHKHTFTQRGD